MFKFKLDTYTMAIVTSASVATAGFVLHHYFALEKLAKDHVEAQTKTFNDLAQDHYNLIVDHAALKNELARLKKD